MQGIKRRATKGIVSSFLVVLLVAGGLYVLNSSVFAGNQSKKYRYHSRSDSPMMQQRGQMHTRRMHMRQEMQDELEEQLELVEESSGEARVNAMVDLLRTMIQQRGEMIQQMQGMHKQMRGMHMMMRGQHMMEEGEHMMGPRGRREMGPGMHRQDRRRMRMHQSDDDS